MAEELDVIQHLIQIEKEASEMQLEAQKQADSIIADARSKAESQFKEKYSVIAKELDSSHEARKKSVLEEHDKLVEEYKNNLNGNTKNFEAFNTLLEEKLFGLSR